ncbi:MAG TPA: galactosyldiacylglycerol synthase [Streptomyces sp.]
MGRFLIVSASMGAGHDTVAAELATRLRAGGHRTAHADLLDLLPAGTGHGLRTAYRAALQHCPWAYQALYAAFFRDHRTPGRRGWLPDTGPLAALIAPRLRRIVDQWHPDALVSTFHQAAQAAGRLRAAHPAACPPSTVVITDFAVHRQWLHPGNDLYLCLTDSAAIHIRSAIGRPAQVCGPLVPAAFTASRRDAPGQAPSPWVRELARYGPGRPAVLISAGAWGVGQGLAATALLLADAGYVPVLLCGRSERLRARTAGLPGVLSLDWTTDLPGLMAASSALIDNAAGQTAIQALAAGVPVIGYRPIPGHGIDGVRAMADAHITERATNPRTLLTALDRLAHPGPYREERIGVARNLFTTDPTQYLAH